MVTSTTPRMSGDIIGVGEVFWKTCGYSNNGADHLKTRPGDQVGALSAEVREKSMPQNDTRVRLFHCRYVLDI